jgi:sterol 14-demethylase
VFADPGRFDPLRFAPGHEEDKQHRFALIGFGGGIHKCAGMNFANNEMAIITALLFQQFDLELVSQDPQVEFGLGAARPTRTIVRYRRKAPVIHPLPQSLQAPTLS